MSPRRLPSCAPLTRMAAARLRSVIHNALSIFFAVRPSHAGKWFVFCLVEHWVRAQKRRCAVFSMFVVSCDAETDPEEARPGFISASFAVKLKVVFLSSWLSACCLCQDPVPLGLAGLVSSDRCHKTDETRKLTYLF